MIARAYEPVRQGEVSVAPPPAGLRSLLKYCRSTLTGYRPQVDQRSSGNSELPYQPELVGGVPVFHPLAPVEPIEVHSFDQHLCSCWSKTEEPPCPGSRPVIAYCDKVSFRDEALREELQVRKCSTQVLQPAFNPFGARA